MTDPAHTQQAIPDAEPPGAAAVLNVWVSGANLVTPPGLPTIGKWMLTRDGNASHWLGEIYEGKSLREPINVILLDTGAGSADEARQRLIAASAAAGYPIRMGHSAGYQGYIGDALHPQIPAGRDDAFSNEVFEVSNNHGRIFGPLKVGDAYVFTGAFSREEVSPFHWPEHRYASFLRAREDFSQRLDRDSRFRLHGLVNLSNALVDNPQVTTGDHDGMAVLLRTVTPPEAASACNVAVSGAKC